MDSEDDDEEDDDEELQWSSCSRGRVTAVPSKTASAVKGDRNYDNDDNKNANNYKLRQQQKMYIQQHVLSVGNRHMCIMFTYSFI